MKRYAFNGFVPHLSTCQNYVKYLKPVRYSIHIYIYEGLNSLHELFCDRVCHITNDERKTKILQYIQLSINSSSNCNQQKHTLISKQYQECYHIQLYTQHFFTLYIRRYHSAISLKRAGRLIMYAKTVTIKTFYRRIKLN